MTITKIVASLRQLAGGLFYLGIGAFVFGHVVTFVPGSEEAFFTHTAVLLAFGLFIPRWHCVAAILLLIACGFEIHEGHQRGLKYRERLEELRAKRSAAILRPRSCHVSS